MKITVVTATYNAEEVVERTLRSVLEQDHGEVEHLIIDGASTDGTMKLVTRYTEEASRAMVRHEVIALSEKDHGLYEAMNKGIHRATGDYIVFLNAGDTFPDQHTLSDIAKGVSREEKLPGVVYGDTDIVDIEGRFLGHRRLSPPEKLSWRSFRQGMLVCHQSFYALTEIAKRTPYDLQYRYSADVDWCIRVMKQSEKEGRKLLNMHRVLTLYLAGGMSIKNHRASLMERFRVMRRHYGLLTTLLMHCWFLVRGQFAALFRKDE